MRSAEKRKINVVEIKCHEQIGLGIRRCVGELI